MVLGDFKTLCTSEGTAYEISGQTMPKRFYPLKNAKAIALIFWWKGQNSKIAFGANSCIKWWKKKKIRWFWGVLKTQKAVYRQIFTLGCQGKMLQKVENQAFLVKFEGCQRSQIIVHIRRNCLWNFRAIRDEKILPPKKRQGYSLAILVKTAKFQNGIWSL